MKNTSANFKKLYSNFPEIENEMLSILTTQNMVTEESVTPPSYMWDRIEQAMNVQDERIATADSMILSSFKSTKRTTFFN